MLRDGVRVQVWGCVLGWAWQMLIGWWDAAVFMAKSACAYTRNHAKRVGVHAPLVADSRLEKCGRSHSAAALFSVDTGFYVVKNVPLSQKIQIK